MSLEHMSLRELVEHTGMYAGNDAKSRQGLAEIQVRLISVLADTKAGLDRLAKDSA
jgi:hypothetical protein